MVVYPTLFNVMVHCCFVYPIVCIHELCRIKPEQTGTNRQQQQLVSFYINSSTFIPRL